MTIDEAIEILEILHDGTVEQIYNERKDALKKGIEALKQTYIIIRAPIPGEDITGDPTDEAIILTTPGESTDSVTLQGGENDDPGK